MQQHHQGNNYVNAWWGGKGPKLYLNIATNKI